MTALDEFLEPEQIQLFKDLCEAYYARARAQRHAFMVLRTMGGIRLQGNDIEGSADLRYGDFEEFFRQGLIDAEYMTNARGMNFEISLKGKQFYEYLRSKAGEQTDQIEEAVWHYFDSPAFQRAYPAAYTKWSEASDLAWSSETQGNLSKIGHICREAMQDFATELIAKYDVEGANADPARTRDRFSAVINARREAIGERKSEVLDALFDYWCAVGNLIQRQEHAGQRQGSEYLVWEDGRRVVFQLGFVMFEAARTLEG